MILYTKLIYSFNLRGETKHLYTTPSAPLLQSRQAEHQRSFQPQLDPNLGPGRTSRTIMCPVLNHLNVLSNNRNPIAHNPSSRAYMHITLQCMHDSSTSALRPTLIPTSGPFGGGRQFSSVPKKCPAKNLDPLVSMLFTNEHNRVTLVAMTPTVMTR